MNILALDLGTTTGWATYAPFTSGSVLLATEKELKAQKKAGLDRCCDMRPMRLLEFIGQFKNVELIVFEDVQFLSSQLQAQLWASLRAMVQIQFPKIKIMAVPVGTLKKFATGKGNAKKHQMVDALQKKYSWRLFHPEVRDLDKPTLLETGRIVDDNEVDARHLLDFAIAKLGLQPLAEDYYAH